MAASARELHCLRRPSSTSRRAMVVSRNANIHYPATPVGESSAQLNLSQRLGSTAVESGPLRVTVHYHHHPALGAITGANRTSSSSLRRYARSYTDTVTSSGDAGGRGVRRVRFDLPPKPPPPSTISVLHNSATSGKSTQQTQVAGVESWLRNRGSSSSYFSSSSSETAGGDYTLSSVGLVSRSRVVLPSSRIHDTERYRKGTLPPSPHNTPPGGACPGPNCSPEAVALLKASRDGDETALKHLLQKAEGSGGLREDDLNSQDSSGRTPVSYIASTGSLSMLEAITQLPGLDINKPDNEGNTPLHFAAQAGHVDIINYLLSQCTGVEVDARNDLGFTPLMKAALQGRTKCAKLLLFAGASPTLRDTGRGLRAEQWARFCGRYVCAEVIEKFARHRLLERTTAYGRWGSEPELGTRLLMGAGKLPSTSGQHSTQSSSFKSRLRRAFRTNSTGSDSPSRYSLVTQLTTAALCASSPVLPTPAPPVVKSLMRPLTVPKVQVTPATTGETSEPVEETSSIRDRPPTAKPKVPWQKKKK